MTPSQSCKQRVGLCLPLIAASCLLLTNVEARADEAPTDRKLFDAPEDGVKALKAAAEAKDRDALQELFGPKIKELESGDEVQDKQVCEQFARRLAKSSRLVREGDDTAIIHIGVEDHPFAVPLVQISKKWFFDTEAGLDEMINRRVGENELNAISVCRGYVTAQREYQLEDRDGDDVLEFAQRLASSAGKKDGLYWEVKSDEPLSPLGPLVAEARAEGYAKSDSASSGAPQPYQGYVFRILTRQGDKAPGGKFDYVINGHMVAGFALIATPVEWGSSGVMTLMVGPNGRIYQKDLGDKTTELAGKIDEFNPADGWSATND
ncbi:MAG TPA: DUF2950 domain-containing protein [Phycisphaerae bacterium]|nr:DUF2950 domain-containing protein [Phycisphaerae bacterium]